MGYKCFLLVPVLILLLSSPVHAHTFCYIVDRDGVEHRVIRWSRLVVREIEPPGEGPTQVSPAGPLDSPAVVNTFVFRGALIPVEDLAYMLPTMGIYALRDNHVIEANPLSECGFSKEHRLVDLEHSRHRSTAGGVERPSRPAVPLLLEVFVEYSATDTVAGYPVAEPHVITIHDAQIVAFDPEAVEAARNQWAARTSSDDSDTLFFPFVTRLEENARLLAAPGGEDAARLKKGANVEVLEIRDEWARVRVEGWVKKETVEDEGH